MPELPEVEATRRHLAPILEGSVITRAEVRRDRMTRRHERPGDFADRVRGRRVRALARRGKFLIAVLDGDLAWVSHLGMSGRLAIAATGDPEPPHTNVVVSLAGGAEVRFIDPRTFGFVAALTPDEFDRAMARIGPDALDGLPPTRHFIAAFAGRTAPIKALLLDQGIVAGLGNIYADEVLYRAGIAPERQGGSLTADDVAAVRSAIGPVLRAGLRHGGTSLDDLAYLLPDGRAGDYLRLLRVYGRTGDPCERCGTPIERVVVRARSSHWCPGCQR